jgi:2-hydroxychromene-2-carboxylate isomerase
MAARLIETYFDYASPFSYIASEQLEEIAARHDAVVDWKPIQVHRLSSFAGRDPYSVSKRKYVLNDARRLAQYFEVPLQPPHPYPVRSETALLLALLCRETESFPSLHREIFHAAWAHQRDISKREVLIDCLRASGADPNPLLDHCKASAVKAQLAALHVDAESKGVFGVPTFVLEGELFWGVDRLPLLEWRLERLKHKHCWQNRSGEEAHGA